MEHMMKLLLAKIDANEAEIGTPEEIRSDLA
jgi:hypothetical protein